MTATPVNRMLDTLEGQRLATPEVERWREWGPYLSERQWGTVREDYSADGDAWAYFPHEHARSRAYRWGEDGLAGFSDKAQRWCLGLALWNERDAIIKERLFGLNNAEGNHGEDVKELYFFVDGVPSHAYMRMLYKYPHAAFPYDDLISENARRGLEDAEYEILDTGVFEDNRYCDVSVEYAKHQPDDIFMRVTVHNRSDQPTRLHVLPQVWARNDWSWTFDAPKPQLMRDGQRVLARHHELPDRHISAWGQDGVEWLFCENETNVAKLDGQPAPGPFKDGINDYVVKGVQSAIQRDRGTKVAARFILELAGLESKTLYLRFAPVDAPQVNARKLFEQRRQEADYFYAALQHGVADDDARNVQRQALAGLLWSKQLYYFDVNQ